MVPRNTNVESMESPSPTAYSKRTKKSILAVGLKIQRTKMWVALTLGVPYLPHVGQRIDFLPLLILLTPLAPYSHMWGQHTLIISSLSPKRNWGPKRVNRQVCQGRDIHVVPDDIRRIYCLSKMSGDTSSKAIRAPSRVQGRLLNTKTN